MARPRTFDDDAVVERAMAVFWAKGYANTSPNELAAATGVGKGSLYNAFGSKRELFDRALARYGALTAEFAADCLSQPGSAVDCIGSFLRQLVDIDVAGEVARGCLTVKTAVELAQTDPVIAQMVRTMQDRTVEALAARIEQGRREGDVSEGISPVAMAEFLLNTINGLRVSAQTYDVPTLHRIIDTALTVLARADDL